LARELEAKINSLFLKSAFVRNSQDEKEPAFPIQFLSVLGTS